MDIHRGYIARIKHKCLITIISMLEMTNPEHGLSKRIRRSIPISILENNLVDIYQKYKTHYKDTYYMRYFNKS